MMEVQLSLTETCGSTPTDSLLRLWSLPRQKCIF
ncbi:hypothetical protein Nmel_017664 [Mimus melanotis]